MSMSATLVTTEYRSSNNLTIAAVASILHFHYNRTYKFFTLFTKLCVNVTCTGICTYMNA